MFHDTNGLPALCYVAAPCAAGAGPEQTFLQFRDADAWAQAQAAVAGAPYGVWRLRVRRAQAMRVHRPTAASDHDAGNLAIQARRTPT